MVMSPARAAELTNGYEQRTSGLFVHKGRGDIGSIRAKNVMAPPSGQGLELLYDPSIALGYLWSYDRDAGAFRDLQIGGRNVTITTTGGALTLPAGSVTSAAIADGTIQTADLAPGAATSVMAYYLAAPSWTNTVTGAWTPTPITATVTTTNAPLLVFGTLNYQHTAVGPNYVGLAMDGVNPSIYELVTTPVVNGYCSVSLTWYAGAPAAGSHSFTIVNYMATAGTFTISTGSHSTLLVVELRR